MDPFRCLDHVSPQRAESFRLTIFSVRCFGSFGEFGGPSGRFWISFDDFDFGVRVGLDHASESPSLSVGPGCVRASLGTQSLQLRGSCFPGPPSYMKVASSILQLRSAITVDIFGFLAFSLLVCLVV